MYYKCWCLHLSCRKLACTKPSSFRHIERFNSEASSPFTIAPLPRAATTELRSEGPDKGVQRQMHLVSREMNRHMDEMSKNTTAKMTMMLTMMITMIANIYCGPKKYSLNCMQ